MPAKILFPNKDWVGMNGGGTLFPSIGGDVPEAGVEEVGKADKVPYSLGHSSPVATGEPCPASGTHL